MSTQTRNRLRRAAVLATAVTALVGLPIGSASAATSSGAIQATCNGGYSVTPGGNAFIDSRQLQPVNGAAEQWIATREWKYNAESRQWAPGSSTYDVYVASASTGWATIGGPDFVGLTGHNAFYVEAFAWTGAAWVVHPAAGWVQFPNGSYWCAG